MYIVQWTSQQVPFQVQVIPIQTTTLPRYIEQVGKWKEVGSEKLTCIDACKRQENKIFTSESSFPSRVSQIRMLDFEENYSRFSQTPKNSS